MSSRYTESSFVKRKIAPPGISGARFIVLQTNTIIFERSVFMATSVMQVRVDDDLRAKAAAVYDELGIDLPTAIISFAP